MMAPTYVSRPNRIIPHASLQNNTSNHTKVHRQRSSESSNASILRPLGLSSASLAAALIFTNVSSAEAFDSMVRSDVVPVKREVIEAMLTDRFSNRIKSMSDNELAKALEDLLKEESAFPTALLTAPVKQQSRPSLDRLDTNRRQLNNPFEDMEQQENTRPSSSTPPPPSQIAPLVEALKQTVGISPPETSSTTDGNASTLLAGETQQQKLIAILSSTDAMKLVGVAVGGSSVLIALYALLRPSDSTSQQLTPEDIEDAGGTAALQSTVVDNNTTGSSTSSKPWWAFWQQEQPASSTSSSSSNKNAAYTPQQNPPPPPPGASSIPINGSAARPTTTGPTGAGVLWRRKDDDTRATTTSPSAPAADMNPSSTISNNKQQVDLWRVPMEELKKPHMTGDNYATAPREEVGASGTPSSSREDIRNGNSMNANTNNNKPSVEEEDEVVPVSRPGSVRLQGHAHDRLDRVMDNIEPISFGNGHKK